MSKLSFHHVALTVANYEEVKNFYINGLGFTLVREWGAPEKPICMLDMGDGGCIELFSNGTAEEVSNAKWLHLALKTENVDETFEKAIKAGATVRSTPNELTLKAEPPYPIKIAFVLGLAGEIIEFFQEM